MTPDRDMTPGQPPGEDESAEHTPRDALDYIDQTVAHITDAEVEEHLRRILDQAGYRPRLDDACLASADLVCCPAAASGACSHSALADAIAAMRREADLSYEQLRSAREAVEAAREQAERIVADARAEADKALDQAVRISQKAQEKAERILIEARNEAMQVVEFASQCAQALPALEPPAKTRVGSREQDLVSCLSGSADSAEALPPAGDRASPRRPRFFQRHLGRAGDSARLPGILSAGSQDSVPIARAGASDGTSFWSSLSPDQQQAFTAKAGKRVFAAGARLMQEGEQADHVAVILSGLTEIRVREGGGERVVAVRGPGQLIGERAALEVSVRSAAVVAVQFVVALVMRTADFAEFVSAYPAVLKIVEDQVYSRLREGTARSGSGQENGLCGDQVYGYTAPNRRHPGSTALRPQLLAGQNCTVVRTDVVAFGAADRNDEDRRVIRHACLAMTRSALGPAWDMSRREDRGDGLLIIVPPSIPTAQVIERLETVLPHELKRHNRLYSAPIRIQLRVAVEVGPVEEDGLGVTGSSIIQASRMLDAPAFKEAIADKGSILGLIASSFVYETAIRPFSRDMAGYAPVSVKVKETSTSAWMQLIFPPSSPKATREQPVNME